MPQFDTLLVRADAGAHIGTGHLMRCLALAEAWRARGGHAIFITACESDVLRRRILEEGFHVATLKWSHPDPSDWEMTSELLAEHPGAWTVLDGYHFDPAYQQRVREAGHLLLVIDDMAHLDCYHADVVLNQNLNAEQLHYSCDPETRLLLGTRYVLLRSEFLTWKGWRRQIPDAARKVLVSLGGSDPDNVTLKVIRALQRLGPEGLESIVCVGASNLHYRELELAVRDSTFPIRLERNVSNMPELMAWADVAISAGGSTCWELAFMGLPNIVLVLAENQRAVPEGLQDHGVAANLGWFASVSEGRLAQALADMLHDSNCRREMSQRGQRLIDAGGVERVLDVMQEQVLCRKSASENP